MMQTLHRWRGSPLWKPRPVALPGIFLLPVKGTVGARSRTESWWAFWLFSLTIHRVLTILSRGHTMVLIGCVNDSVEPREHFVCRFPSSSWCRLAFCRIWPVIQTFKRSSFQASGCAPGCGCQSLFQAGDNGMPFTQFTASCLIC